VTKREPVGVIAAFIESVPAGQTQNYRALYELKSLYLAASEESKAKLLFDFHGYPYREGATGLVGVRERWYDSAVGGWLTSDALQYRDSANLYAFAGWDPVNGRDPTGLQEAKGTPLEEEIQEELLNDALEARGIDPLTGRPIHELREEEEREESLNRIRERVGLGRRTAEKLTPEEQEELIRNARRIMTDPQYRARQEAVRREFVRTMLPRYVREQIDILEREQEEGADVNTAPARRTNGRDRGPGIVYLRVDRTGGAKPYVGQAISQARFVERQIEHARAHPNADFEFVELGRAEPGEELDVLEESYMRAGGGPTSRRNPSGELSNRRVQMNEARYRAAGGTVPK
jgi:RHS repeat-associated protein